MSSTAAPPTPKATKWPPLGSTLFAGFFTVSLLLPLAFKQAPSSLDALREFERLEALYLNDISSSATFQEGGGQEWPGFDAANSNSLSLDPSDFSEGPETHIHGTQEPDIEQQVAPDDASPASREAPDAPVDDASLVAGLFPLDGGVTDPAAVEKAYQELLEKAQAGQGLRTYFKNPSNDLQRLLPKTESSQYFKNQLNDPAVTEGRLPSATYFKYIIPDLLDLPPYISNADLPGQTAEATVGAAAEVSVAAEAETEEIDSNGLHSGEYNLAAETVRTVFFREALNFWLSNHVTLTLLLGLGGCIAFLAEKLRQERGLRSAQASTPAAEVPTEAVISELPPAAEKTVADTRPEANSVGKKANRLSLDVDLDADIGLSPLLSAPNSPRHNSPRALHSPRGRHSPMLNMDTPSKLSNQVTDLVYTKMAREKAIHSPRSGSPAPSSPRSGRLGKFQNLKLPLEGNWQSVSPLDQDVPSSPYRSRLVD